MAEATRTFTGSWAHGSLRFICYLDYDDADWQTINDDGDPDDFRLIRFRIINYNDKPLLVTINRGNGQNWVTRSIPADGQEYTQAAGGAVKYESDLPQWYWEWGS